MSLRHDHWIAGKAEAPAGGAYLPTIDPATRQPGDEVARGTAADVDRAVTAAAEAQPDWARAAGADRSEALHRVADAIEDGSAELMDVERACTGKLPGQLRLEVDMSAAYFRYYAGVLRSVGGRTIDLGGGQPHLHPARALRRGRRHHALEPAAEPGVPGAGAGAGRRATRWWPSRPS